MKVEYTEEPLEPLEMTAERTKPKQPCEPVNFMEQKPEKTLEPMKPRESSIN